MAEPVRSDALEMRQISKHFGGQLAVNGVDLVVQAGEVHGLIGQNGAGKSTVVNILAGRLKPNEGEVRHADRVLVSPTHVEKHLETLVTVVHQEGSVLPALTIGENLVLGEDRAAPSVVSRKAMRARVATAYEALGLPVPDASALCSKLPPADRKILEIVRAFSSGARFVLLDEPSASLDPRMTDWLIAAMHEAARVRSLGIIFVSHRLREVQRGTDVVTILRDGKVVWDGPCDGITPAEMVGHIAGKEIAARVGEASQQQKGRHGPTSEGPPALKLTGFTCGTARDISLKVDKGEIVGVAGVEGQGQRDLFYALAGTRRYQGVVELGGRQVRLRNRRAAIQAGVMFLADDRARQGVIAPMTIADNMIVASIGTLGAVPGWRSRTREREFVEKERQRFSIKMAGPRSFMRELSGGNQQKVLLARSLSNEGRLVVLFEPTQGVDVGVKADIYAQLSDLAAKGLGVLIYSSDEDELSLVSDRVVVLGKGRVVAELTGENMSRDVIVEAMVGYSDVEAQLGPEPVAGTVTA
jgi:ABC-type sugar transport system ATPase subunit